MTDNKKRDAGEAGIRQDYNPMLSAKECHQAISTLGIRKANTESWQLLLLGILAGIYISVGSHLFLVAMQAGMGRLVAGAAFGVGLVLVVVAGAELVTGNIIMVVGSVTRKFSVGQMARNWMAVFAGNLIGAYLFVTLMWLSGLLGHGGEPSAIGTLAIEVARAKLSLGFTEAFVRGILCNMLVILAIIMSILSKDTLSKIACCILPIMAFVASGFEHCVANMYLIPAGLVAGSGSMVAAFQVSIFNNLIPVTLGNIVGGMFILFLHPNRIRQLAYLLKRPGPGATGKP
jgi:formate/nitrite transporter